MNGATAFEAPGARAPASAAAESLTGAIERATGENVFRCYHCGRCTSGCPLAEHFDLTPNQVIRGLQLDDTGVLASRTIWLCASCQTCTTRCPQKIDVAAIMDALCVEATRRGVAPAVPEIAAFNRLFMGSVKLLGRAYELGFGIALNLAQRTPFKDLRMALALLRRGRLHLVPRLARRAERTETAAAHSDRAVGFFPGCALDSSAVEYGRSARATAAALDIELVEPPGWQCCGATPAPATDPALAVGLPMRGVASVERMGLDTVTSPCSKCFARLKFAEHAARRGDDVSREARARAGYDYRGTVKVQHFLDTLLDRAGLAEIEARVRRPLETLRVACYYGCLITRPAALTGAEHPEYPTRMDDLLRALGADPVDWSYKTECCGGALGVSQTPIALELSRKVLENALACGAEAVVTMCPLCHMNLDARQPEIGLDRAVPVLHATQLAALAFGLEAKAAALDKNVIDPRPLLAGKGLFCRGVAGR
ncbi:MAG: heterodisulfide reductase-related iron-sulfur binding cluster [Rhodospirillales bacterium]|nr:heterodisulfide reductase-related iron-sulfur binding cluster [Rhodospirillales bacterium]